MLVVENLSFGFPHRPILKNFSLTVNQGELVHISGPNGAGKSTLMALIAGLIPPDHGEVFFKTSDGKVVDNPRIFIEYMPAESNALFLKMNAPQNLAFWVNLRQGKVQNKILIDELRFWGLAHPLLLGNFPVEKYSTGMKRRLALARLRLASTPCWLLDEPVYGLDSGATGSFRSILKEHLSKGGMAVMISHDTSAFLEIPHRKIDLGRIQEENG